MKIIGDPYWLGFSSENIPLLNKALPHLIMCTKTFTRNDGWDDPKEDKSMEINTVYAITSITSTFSDGTFTQELEGAVPPPFVQEDIENQISLPIDNSRTNTIIETKDGGIVNLSSVYDAMQPSEIKIDYSNGKLNTYLQPGKQKTGIEKVNEDITNKWKEDSLKEFDSMFEKYKFDK